MTQINLGDPESSQLFAMQLAVHKANKSLIEGEHDPMLLESRAGSLCKPRISMDELVTLTPEALGAVLRTCIEPIQVKPKKGTKSTEESIDEEKDEEQEEDSPGEVKRDEESGKEIIVKPSIPIRLVKAYMGIKDWPGVSVVKQTARAPIVRPDFSVRWEPGWDEATSCWVLPGVERDDSYSGFDLRGLFAQFALASPTYIADLLAAALTPYFTTAIDSPYPGLLITARSPGSGKTYLAQLMGLLGNCGNLPEVTSWKSPDHMSNAITSAVNSDDRLVIFDNIKGDIDSPELEGVITGRGISERRYHTQETMKLRSNTSWFMTANGAAASPDMVRRCIATLLDKEVNPVAWNGAIVPWMMEREAALVTRMIELIEDWRDAGCAPGSLMHPGFERWSVAVSGVLEHAGYEGMWEGRDRVLDTAVSTGTDDEAELINRIARVMGDSDGWTAGDMFDRVNDPGSARYLDVDATYLRKWIETITKGKKSPGMAVGWQLGKMVGNALPGATHTIEKRSREYICVAVAVKTDE